MNDPRLVAAYETIHRIMSPEESSLGEACPACQEIAAQVLAAVDAAGPKPRKRTRGQKR